eukprot:scaffold7349_cov173-Amphora_coffeaeformis.AAC.7
MRKETALGVPYACLGKRSGVTINSRNSCGAGVEDDPKTRKVLNVKTRKCVVFAFAVICVDVVSQ